MGEENCGKNERRRISKNERAKVSKKSGQNFENSKSIFVMAWSTVEKNKQFLSKNFVNNNFVYNLLFPRKDKNVFNNR